MTETVLLTLGRLPKALEIARALSGAGARVIVAEPFRRHLCAPSRCVAKTVRTPAPAVDPEGYLGALLETAEREGVDRIVPISEEILHVARLAPRLPDRVALYAPPLADLLRVHDKLRFARLAQEWGLRAPETAAADAPEAAAIAADGPYVTKSRWGCSGAGLAFGAAGEPPAAPDPGLVVQRRVDGRLLSAQALAADGELVGLSVYEGAVFTGTVAAAFRRVDDAPEVGDWVARFVQRAGWTGFVAFDFIVDADGPVALECNPRATSGVHFFEPQGLAAAILGLPTETPLPLKTTRAFQEGHTTLLEAYGRILRPREFAGRIAAVARTRDVLWSRDDPWPFFLMTPMSWEVLKPALFDGLSFGEAATRDIAWRSAEGAPPPPVSAPAVAP